MNNVIAETRHVQKILYLHLYHNTLY